MLHRLWLAAEDFASCSEGIESLRVVKDDDLLVLLRVVTRASLRVVSSSLWWLLLIRPVVCSTTS